MKGISSAFNLLAFVLCSAAFAWKVYDGFVKYYEQDISTRTELKFNYEEDLPGFAVCRHPNQVISEFNKDFESIFLKYKVSVDDLRYPHFFDIIEAQNLTVEDVYAEFLMQDIESIHELTILSRGQFSHDSLPSYRSKLSEDWDPFYHPVYGYCYLLKPIEKLANLVGNAGIEYIKIEMNFAKAYPQPPTPTTFAPIDPNSNDTFETFASPLDFIAFLEEGENQLLVITHSPGSLITGFESALGQSGTYELYTLSQEVIDKSQVYEKYNCNENSQYVEDECLMRCLVQKSVENLGCLHFRLLPLNISVGSSTKPCTSIEIREKTDEFLVEIRKQNHGTNVSEEFGLVDIRRILASFNQDNPEQKCGCQSPCRKQIIKLSKWDYKGHSGLSPPFQRGFTIFNLSPVVKEYTYQIVYSGSLFLADIGGYLGLFLGLSAFGLVELLTTAIDAKLCTRKKEERRTSVETPLQAQPIILAQPT